MQLFRASASLDLLLDEIDFLLDGELLPLPEGGNDSCSLIESLVGHDMCENLVARFGLAIGLLIHIKNRRIRWSLRKLAASL